MGLLNLGSEQSGSEVLKMITFLLGEILLLGWDFISHAKSYIIDWFFILQISWFIIHNKD